MKYRIGEVVRWIPQWWKWDTERDLIVSRVYPRNRAMLSNGVIVDENGFAMIYDSNRCVGRIEPVEQ